MALKMPYAGKLTHVDSNVLLRAMGATTFLADPGNLEAVKAINGATDELDRAGAIGLTVSFEEIRTATSSEGLFGKLLGKKGNFYVVATVLDGSGKPFEYKTQFFQGIARGARFPLGDGGMLVSYMQNPRWFIDIHMLVMESDSEFRQLGAAVDDARKEVKLDDVLASVAVLRTFDPTGVTRIVKAVDMFAAALAYLLKKNGDDHVATIHDFYLKPQAFGKGRHPVAGRKIFQKVEVAYKIELTQL